MPEIHRHGEGRRERPCAFALTVAEHSSGSLLRVPLTGDRAKALTALNAAEPIIMRAAQQGIVHKNSASRKVSRLTHRVAELGK